MQFRARMTISVLFCTIAFFGSSIYSSSMLSFAAPHVQQSPTVETEQPTNAATLEATSVATAIPLQEIEFFIPEVISVRPHDAGSFTQGLLLDPDGTLYESAGLEGESDIRQVDAETGEILRKFELPAEFFAEGLALVDDRLIQITWKNEEAFVWDVDTFDSLGGFDYTGEGWGLCYDGEFLYMSDGSANLFRRDPKTFELLETIPVTYQGQPVLNLNELECVDDSVYANLWYQDWIVRIDKSNGNISGVIDASALMTPEERAELGSSAVLNGIAYDSETGNFLLTGKHWPKLFEVRLVPYEVEE